MEEDTLNLIPPRVEQKLTDWENEPTVEDLKNDLEKAKASHDAQYIKIQKWIELRDITGSAKPKSRAGRSQVQPKLIRRQAEWRYSALTEPFLSSDKIFNVNPRTFEDEASAKQNEILLNYQFDTKLNKVKFIDNLVRSCVDEGTCFVRLGWNRETRPIMETVPVYSYYPVRDPILAQTIQRALELKNTDPKAFNELAPDLQESASVSEETQELVQAITVGSQEVQSEEVIENCPVVEVLDPANIYVDPSCNGDLNKALFVIISFETNKAELQKAGIYQNLDSVDWESAATPVADGEHLSQTPYDFNFTDSLRKKVVAYEYWGFYDLNGNGILQPFVATWIGNTLIRMSENPFPDRKLPFVVIPYMPVKRQLFGEPDAELLSENQKILGAITRGLIDSLGRSAVAQQGFAKGMLDPLNKRRFEAGEDYEFNPNIPIQNGYIEHSFPELPQSAMQMIQLQNMDAESLTGVKAFSGGISGDAYGQVVAGIQSALDAAAKREMAILRRIAKGMKEVGEKIIAMNSEFLSDEEVVRVTNNQYVTIKREDIKGNFDLKVDINTAEVDNAKAQDLGFMLQTIGPNLDPKITLFILSEIAELKRMPALAQTLRTYQPQPDPVQEQLKQLEVQKLQSEIELNKAKILELQAKAQAENADTQLTVSGVKHKQELEKQQAQAEGNKSLEVTKALLKPLKDGELSPDIESAIGYNILSDSTNPNRSL